MKLFSHCAQVLALMGLPVLGYATDYDHFAGNRLEIRNGVQAVLMCNGLFTSERTLPQVLEQELAYLKGERFAIPGESTSIATYSIDEARRAVTVGDRRPVSAMFRKGIGCVVLDPATTPAEPGPLPQMTLAPLAGDPAGQPWPMGDETGGVAVPADVDAQALAAAERWAFERDTPEQDTLSLLVVHRGQIILERYAPGVTRDTRTRTWSTAKSIVATLIGMLVDQDKMQLDASLGIDWLPSMAAEASDPRAAITLRQALNMTSGLYPVDSFNAEYATGSGLSYWAGASSVDGARNRGLVREPGSFWDYENYDTLLAVYAMKQALGDAQTYLEFPRMALFDRIGMRNTLASTDRFGDFIFSSQVYTNARDLARFGLLYLNDGVWQGERLISNEWIDFVRTPAPATVKDGGFYGGQWWLVPSDRHDVPADAYATAGNRGQYVIVVPTHDVVIVRRGLDWGKQGFDRWDLTREVLKAIPPVTPPAP